MAILLLQSKIIVPQGYEAIIYPLPKASRMGLIARTEPFYSEPSLSRAPVTTIMLEASNRIGSMYFRGNHANK
jgi:hypothetical protein